MAQSCGDYFGISCQRRRLYLLVFEVASENVGLSYAKFSSCILSLLLPTVEVQYDALFPRAFLRRSGAEGQVCVPGVGSVKTEACEVLTMPMNLTKFALVNIQAQMTIQEAIQARHSVRQYIDKPITEDVVAALKAKIDEVNAEAGLHIQLILNEPKSFQCAMAKYGKRLGMDVVK